MPITKASSNAVAAAAKGDLVVGNAANDSGVLAVGSTNQILTVDSTTATGLKWATPASSVPANSSATVATSQTTTSTSYTDLATAGPAVTVTTGTKALVIVTGYMDGNSTSRTSFMSYAVSSATTIAASDTVAVAFLQGPQADSTTLAIRASAASVPTLTAGSNTFTAKYKVTAGTATFANREIFVINLA